MSRTPTPLQLAHSYVADLIGWDLATPEAFAHLRVEDLAPEVVAELERLRGEMSTAAANGPPEPAEGA